MTIIVEDGTGGNALIDGDYFAQFASDMGWDIDSYDDTEIEPAIRRASIYISNAFTYQGYKKNGRTQIQAFPRVGMLDNEGFGIDPDSIPREAQMATGYATMFELTTPGGLAPSGSLSQLVRQETVGPISIQYLDRNSGVEALRPTLYAVKDILSPLITENAGSNNFVGRADRG